jgi:3-hydroxybutyryl-CoA dehydrogenase
MDEEGSVETAGIDTVCIVGAGFMGAQIGLQCAVHGYRVWLVDTSEEALVQAARVHGLELERRVEKGRITALDKAGILDSIGLTTDLAEGVSAADLVIEAIPERLEVKREVFRRLDDLCPARTILATNSSSIRVSRIEDATRRPDKVLNLHFYGPVWERPMVDIQRGTQTSDATFEQGRAFVHSIGCTPLLVQRESTGFVFNRVWRAVKRECLHLVDDGVASFEDVDRAWMIFNGAPLGPFGLMDMIGLDVIRDIEQVYYGESGEERDAPPRLLLEKIERGELGVKTGKGFYEYPNPAFEDPSWLQGRADGPGGPEGHLPSGE